MNRLFKINSNKTLSLILIIKKNIIQKILHIKNVF